jgi:hypothetical protein
LGLGAAFAVLPYLLLHQWSTPGLLLFVVVASFTLITLYFAWQGAFQRASLSLFAMAILSYFLGCQLVLPQLKPLWLSNRVAQVITKYPVEPNKPLLAVDFAEPSLVFNLNTEKVQFVDAQLAALILQLDPSRLALIKPSTLERWNNKQLAVVADLQGYHYSKGNWLDLLIVRGAQNVPL